MLKCFIRKLFSNAEMKQKIENSWHSVIVNCVSSSNHSKINKCLKFFQKDNVFAIDLKKF